MKDKEGEEHGKNYGGNWRGSSLYLPWDGTDEVVFYGSGKRIGILKVRKGEAMEDILEFMGDGVISALAATGVIALVLGLLANGGVLHEVVLVFAGSICG